MWSDLQVQKIVPIDVCGMDWRISASSHMVDLEQRGTFLLQKNIPQREAMIPWGPVLFHDLQNPLPDPKES